jgi:YD repeat-containing protein
MFTRRTTFKAVTSVTVAFALGASPVFGALEQPQVQAACPTCGSEPSVESTGTLVDSAASVARDSVPLTLLPVTTTPHEGVPFNYVQSATGQVAFSVVDMDFQCQLPITLMRYYNSGQSGVQSGLGKGWSLLIDDQVKVEGASARLRSGSGETVDMKLDPRGAAFEPLDPAGTYHTPLRRADDGTLREQMGEATRIYTPDGNVYRLTSVDYGDLGSIQVSRDRRGRITKMAASDNPCSIGLTWSAGEQARLLSATDNTGRSVTYAYAGDQLSGVTDVAGSAWRYFYEGAGPLARVVDPEGTAALRVTYSGGRAETSETIEGLARFSYQQDGAILNPTVTSPKGEATVVHNAFGQIVSLTPKTGFATKLTYDAGRRLVAVDGPGVRQRYEYDAQDRRILSDVNGRLTRWEYDAEGRVARRFNGANWIAFAHPDKQTMTVSSPIARLNSRSTFESGRLVRSVGAAGEETYAYDALGQLAAYTDRSGQLTFQNDAHGWLQVLGLPNGTSVEYVRDARGAITVSRENSGRSLKYERDRRGALVAVTSSDGGWVRATRDKDGHIVRLTNSRNQTRAFSYDASGRLASYTNALGQAFRMQYDKQGAPVRLKEEGGKRAITRPFGSAPRRANPGGQVRTTNLDVDDWYDPDNPEGVLGSFHQIRGALRTTGKGNTGQSPQPPAGIVGGPVDTSADALDALLCEQNNCQACRTAALNACQAGANDCRRRASLVFYICVLACGTLAETVIGYFICTGVCVAQKVNNVANCQGGFNTCKLTIPGQCASVCQ